MKKKYSTLLNFALAACVATTLAACSDGDTTGSTGAKYSNPKIDIGGVVQDTNGNPLADVSVSCQGTTVKTNALGQYIAKNLKVTNVAGADNDTAHNPVSCVIGAPAGYLGATVTVYPEAQIDDTPSTGNPLDVVDSVTNPRTTFIDGMYAEAGTAVLPALNSEVCGRLENCTTEEGYAGVELRLDLVDVGEWDVDQEQEQDYVSTSYATAMYSTTTDAMGNFCITGVPNDSELHLYVPGWDDYDTGDAHQDVYTSHEGLEALGDICVNPIVTGDSQRPCLVGVTDYVHGWDPPTFGQTFTSTQSLGGGQILWAVLEDDVDGTGDGFYLMFNETMDPDEIDENSVIIWNEGPNPLDPSDDEYVTDFTATLSGKALQIVTAEPLGDDDHLKIYMLLDDFQDTAGNYLATQDMLEDDGVCDNTPGQWNLPWINDFISNNNTLYAVAGVKIFSPDSTDVGEVSDLAQVCLDGGGDAGFAALNAAYPSVFTDMDSGTAGFQNLNADDDDWEERLEALADAQGSTTATVENGVALITYMTPSEGSNSVTSGVTTYCGSTPNTGSTQSCVIDPASVGQVVFVTSEDDFGNPSNVVSITLGDCAAPTTVLNYAYNTCGHVGYDLSGTGLGTNHFATDSDTNYAAHLCTVGEVIGDPAYGDGGENTDDSTASMLGLPTLNITCRLLKDPDDAPGVTPPIDFFGLYGQIDTYDAGPNNNIDELYDATGYAAWVPFEDSIGVAFSEDIAMTTGGSIDWSGDASIDSWSIGNNISTQDDGDSIDDTSGYGNVGADLVQLTIDDIITLANDDHGEIMDFSDAVEDTAGNSADNARVVINDLLPPFVTNAYWDGDLVITFNEPVSVCLDITTGCTENFVTLLDPTDTGSGVYGGNVTIGTDGGTLSVDGMTLTIPSSNIAAPLAGTFDRAQHFPGLGVTGNLVYSESIYDTIITNPLTEYAHGRMNFDNIETCRATAGKIGMVIVQPTLLISLALRSVIHQSLLRLTHLDHLSSPRFR
jgi:hypothetical protein